jgi:UDP-N-acetylglucosamine acyltransferase
MNQFSSQSFQIHPTAKIHKTAIVSELAQIGAGAEVQAFAVIDDDVIVGENCIIGPRSHLYSGTRLGSEVHIWDGAIVGAPPPDQKYIAGTTSFLFIDSKTHIREFATIHKSALAHQSTRIGKNCLLLAYSHVGHDSILEDGVVLSNGVQLGGHVFIGQKAVIGGNTAIQQFSHIGELSFVGGTLKIDRHIPPYSKALGNPLKWAGVNKVGLERHGLSTSEISELYIFYSKLFKSKSNISQEAQNITPEFDTIYTKKIREFLIQNPRIIARNSL